MLLILAFIIQSCRNSCVHHRFKPCCHHFVSSSNFGTGLDSATLLSFRFSRIRWWVDCFVPTRNPRETPSRSPWKQRWTHHNCKVTNTNVSFSIKNMLYYVSIMEHCFWNRIFPGHILQLGTIYFLHTTYVFRIFKRLFVTLISNDLLTNSCVMISCEYDGDETTITLFNQ